MLCTASTAKFAVQWTLKKYSAVQSLKYSTFKYKVVYCLYSSIIADYCVSLQRGKPVRKVAALTRNFSHGVHTSLNFRQYWKSLKNLNIINLLYNK